MATAVQGSVGARCPSFVAAALLASRLPGPPRLLQQRQRRLITTTTTTSSLSSAVGSKTTAPTFLDKRRNTNRRGMVHDNNASSSWSSSSSVSSQEVDKFSDMDAQWWDVDRNPLIGMNACRMEYIQQHLPPNTSRVLDVGCGGGLLCESLARILLRRKTEEEEQEATAPPVVVVGLDPSPRLIATAQAHAQLDFRTASSIDYRLSTVEDYARDVEETKQPLFDAVCVLEVLEHVDRRAEHSLLEAAARLLRPDGRLFVSTLNRTVKSFFLTIVGAEYAMRYLPVGTHNWNLYRSPEETHRLLRRHGLEPVEGAASGMIPTSIPPFGGWKWRLDPHDTDVNWIGVYRKVED